MLVNGWVTWKRRVKFTGAYTASLTQKSCYTLWMDKERTIHVFLHETYLSTPYPHADED